MPNVLTPQEEATIRAFIIRERRERFLELLPNPKKRRSITESLAHPNPAWFDQRYVRAIPSSLSHEGIASLLRKKGAGDKCWAISEDPELDGRELDLRRALDKVIGSQMGTILCIVPGKLAIVESEYGRFMMEKLG
jgi:hypothetical protein